MDNLDLYRYQARVWVSLRDQDRVNDFRTSLRSNIRVARLTKFQVGDIVKLSFPETRHMEAFSTLALLGKSITIEEHREYCRKHVLARPSDPTFYSQHFWMGIVGEESLPLMEVFMSLENRNEWY